MNYLWLKRGWPVSIKAVCECGKKFQARDEFEGRRAICPACKREFIFQAAGIPIFEEATESAPAKTDIGKELSCPDAAAVPPAGTPFWRNPIIVFGWVTPMLALFAFCVYLAWPHAQPKLPVAQQRDVGVPRRNPKIPVEPSYKITEEVIGYGGTRRSVRVLLSSKVSEGVLRETALEIKATEPAAYSDTLIWYYLSGKGLEMEPHRPVWARASFVLVVKPRSRSWD